MGVKMKTCDSAQQRISLQKLIPVIGLVLIVVIFEILSRGRLLALRNLKNILIQSYPVIIISVGAVFVFAHGGMDLSYGGVLGVSMFTAAAAAAAGWPLIVVFGISLLTAVMWYVVNGGVTIFGNVPSFIASLCVLYMCRGILNTVCSQERKNIPPALFAYDNWAVKLPVLITVVFLAWLIFEKTGFGKGNRAAGGNAYAALQSGIKVSFVKFAGYLVSAVTVGIAAFFSLLRAGSVTTSTGQGLEMNIITALVLGGVSLSGGTKTKMINAVLGAVMVILLRNALIVTGVNERIVEGIQGVALLLLVFLTYSRDKNSLLT
jgi:ribose transport system permease protein